MIGKILVLVLIILAGMSLGAYEYYIHYQYEKEIGGYLDNARDMNTPSRMIEQLELAKQGMVNAGLKEEDYGALIFKKQTNSMGFQYQHLDSILERAIAVEEWKQKTYGNESQTQTESLGDVYETKMDNLREFIMEGGRSDWIAKNTWYIKNHVVMYLSWIFWGILLILFITILILIAVEANL